MLARTRVGKGDAYAATPPKHTRTTSAVKSRRRDMFRPRIMPPIALPLSATDTPERSRAPNDDGFLMLHRCHHGYYATYLQRWHFLKQTRSILMRNAAWLCRSEYSRAVNDCQLSRILSYQPHRPQPCGPSMEMSRRVRMHTPPLLCSYTTPSHGYRWSSTQKAKRMAPHANVAISVPCAIFVISGGVVGF